MSASTKSERLFEAFCQLQGLRCRRLEANGRSRLADYEVTLRKRSLIAEVKQFDPNAEERRLVRQLAERGYTDGYGTTPGGRVRRKISQAVPQLKALCGESTPGVLVLFDNVGLVTGHTHPYNIKTGLYGTEVVDIAFDPKRRIGPRAVERRFGPNRKVGPDVNTTLSAVAVLSSDGERLALDVFHNSWARVPVDPEELRGEGVRHFKIGAKATGEFQEWLEV